MRRRPWCAARWAYRGRSGCGAPRVRGSAAVAPPSGGCAAMWLGCPLRLAAAGAMAARAAGLRPARTRTPGLALQSRCDVRRAVDPGERRSEALPRVRFSMGPWSQHGEPAGSEKGPPPANGEFMSEADRVFPRQEVPRPGEEGTHASPGEKRLILSAPRRSRFGAAKSRVVEVVHVRRGRSTPTEGRSRPAPGNVRAETWPSHTAADPAQPPPRVAHGSPARRAVGRRQHHLSA
jgi:hypothetical protein